MARCPHNNVQQFTEYCLDCGRNIYETDEEYLRYLRGRKRDQLAAQGNDEIQRLERELGIRHPGNANNDDEAGYDTGIGW